MDSLNLIFDPFPTLKTDRLLLRKLELTDAKDYHEIRSNPKVLKYVARPLAQSLEDTIGVIERVYDTIEKQEGINWAICLKNSPKTIGTIGFYRTQAQHFRTEIGYELRPELWGQGIMSEAMQAVLDYAFFTMNFHSVEANIDPVNRRSENILLRNNFIKEAHFRENYFFEGKFTDSAIYSLLKSRHQAMTGKK